MPKFYGEKERGKFEEQENPTLSPTIFIFPWLALLATAFWVGSKKVKTKKRKGTIYKLSPSFCFFFIYIVKLFVPNFPFIALA